MPRPLPTLVCLLAALATAHADGRQYATLASDNQLAHWSRAYPETTDFELTQMYDRGGPITDDGLAVLATLKKLESLRLHSLEISGEGLEHLAGRRLHTLGLCNCPKLTPASLRHLAALPKLEELTLSECPKLDAKALGHVLALKGLRRLTISCEALPAEAYRTIARHPGLRELTVTIKPPVDARTLAALVRCKALTELTLDASALKEADYASLAVATHLTSLALENATKLTSRGLRHLAGLTRLTTLHVSSSQIDDGGLPALRGMRALDDLVLTDCGRLTGSGFAALGTLTNLTTLNLQRCAIDAVGARAIARLPEVYDLDLTGCTSFDDAALRALSGMAELNYLTLTECTKIKGLGFSGLAACPELISIDLDGCTALEGQTLTTLARCKKLNEVELGDGDELLSVESHHLTALLDLRPNLALQYMSGGPGPGHYEAPEGLSLSVRLDDEQLILSSGDERHEIPIKDGDIRSYDLSPQHDLLAVLRDDRRVELWEVASRRLIRTLAKVPNSTTLLFSANGQNLYALRYYGQARSWNVAAQLAGPRRVRPRRLSWTALARLEPSEAYASLARYPLDAAGLAALEKRLQLPPPPDEEQLLGWIDDLGARSFRMRRKAFTALQRAGVAAVAALREARADPDTSREQRKQIDALLAALHPSSPFSDKPETLRAARLIRPLLALPDGKGRPALKRLAAGGAGPLPAALARRALSLAGKAK